MIRYIDLFCGIGGFRFAIERVSNESGSRVQCLLSSDIDFECQRAYEANFKVKPLGDIQQINEADIPDHDLLLGGFPCQPFSIIGKMRGFQDMRGTLFFEIARILDAKRPSAFLLENVKLLVGHDGGRTLQRILKSLRDIGYYCDFRVLNALAFGLPQKRERVFIVGFRNKVAFQKFQFPEGGLPMIPLSKILETKVSKKHYASEYIQKRRWAVLKPTSEPTIWHENKAGHISAYPYSCALRAGASYNYLLVNGKRRLTPREMLRLQGFPDSLEIVCNDSQTRRQAGNAVPVPVVKAILKELFIAQKWIGLSDSKQTYKFAPKFNRFKYGPSSEITDGQQVQAAI